MHLSHFSLYTVRFGFVLSEVLYCADINVIHTYHSVDGQNTARQKYLHFSPYITKIMSFYFFGSLIHNFKKHFNFTISVVLKV